MQYSDELNILSCGMKWRRINSITTKKLDQSSRSVSESANIKAEQTEKTSTSPTGGDGGKKKTPTKVVVPKNAGDKKQLDDQMDKDRTSRFEFLLKQTEIFSFFVSSGTVELDYLLSKLVLTCIEAEFSIGLSVWLI